MSTSSWIADALLGSPIPPPNWLDPRYRGTGWQAPAARWPGAALFGSIPSYKVSGSKIGVELDEVNSSVNPPVIQGWAWCLAFACVGAVLLGLMNMGTAAEPMATLLTFLPFPFWIACVVTGAYLSYDIGLRSGSIYVRRWTDVRFSRPGRLVGSRESMHAVLSCGNHVQLEGDHATVEVSMEMWPSSSRRGLQSRLGMWGVDLEYPDGHHAHHPRHWNHGHHRFEHRIG